MSDLIRARDEDTIGEWTDRNLAAVVTVMVRTVRDAALAFDLVTELLAIAALQWEHFRGEESRMAWVLGLAPALIDRALVANRVPCDERMRNRSYLEPRVLTGEDLDWVSSRIDVRLELDPEARRVAARLERDAPAPGRLPRLALSPLIRLEGVRERS